MLVFKGLGDRFCRVSGFWVVVFRSNQNGKETTVSDRDHLQSLA